MWKLTGILALVCVGSAAAAQPAGIVKIANGSVAIERSGERHPAAAGARVEVGDRVVTGADGSVGITLRDNTLLSAGPQSVLVVEKFVFNSTTHAGELDASLRRGTLAVISGKIARQSPEAVRFRTPNAILGVRGTAFVVDAGEASLQ